MDGELLCDMWASLCHPMPGTWIRQGQQRDAQLSPLTSLPLVCLFTHGIVAQHKLHHFTLRLFYREKKGWNKWLFLSIHSRFGSGGSSGVFNSRGRSQRYLHCPGESERWAPHPCGGVRWQRPCFWHHFLCAQVLRGWRVRFQLICLLHWYQSFKKTKNKNVLFLSCHAAWLMTMSETSF